jgi:ABC-2 type transport system permease protein
VLTWFSTVSLGAVFASSGVAPMDLFPHWVRPAVQFQPMSSSIEAMKALARDGFAMRPLLWTFAWILAIGILAGTLAMRSYRAAAQSG